MTGFLIALLSVSLICFMIFTKVFLGMDYPLGIPTVTVLVLFIGGVQMLSIGLIGEYIGRIYDEVRMRPLWIIEKAYNVEIIDRRGPRSGP